MARPMHLADSSSLIASQPSDAALRRSSRLRLRGGVRPYVKTAGPSIPDGAPARSTRNRGVVRVSSLGTTKPATKVRGHSGRARRVAEENISVALPKQLKVAPRSTTKRRRDDEESCVKPLSVDAAGSPDEAENEFRTPRALRALKRQRRASSGSSDVSCPMNIHHPAPQSPPAFSPFGSRVSFSKVDNDPRPLPPGDAGILENIALIRQAESRNLSDARHTFANGTVLLPSISDAHVLTPSTNEIKNVKTALAPRATDGPIHEEDTLASLAVYSTTLSSATEFKDSCSVELVIPASEHSDANTRPTVTPASALAPRLPHCAIIPSSPLSRPPLSSSLTDASEDDELYGFSSWSVRVRHPIRDRIRRPESRDHNIWKLACHERIGELVHRYTREIVRAVVVAQAKRQSPPPEFRLYTPDNYTGSRDDIGDTNDSFMDLDDEDDEDWDDEASDDEDISSGELGDMNAAGFDVMDLDVSDNSPSSPFPAHEHHADPADSAAPDAAAPTLEEYSPAPAIPLQLPPLTSVRALGLESCPQRTPDGIPYVGRGTPVDRQRRADWANIRLSQYFSLGQPEWLTALSLSPSPPSNPSTLLPSDMSYGVPQDVSPFCCTEQGVFGAASTQAYGVSPDSVSSTSSSVASLSYTLPPPQPHPDGAWLEPALRPASPTLEPMVVSPSPPSPPYEAHFTAAPSVLPFPGAAQPHPQGCAWHGSFMQCLMASGVGCSPALPGPLAVGAPVPTPAEVTAVYEVPISMDPMPVQVSSTLSHALG
ncbi:uncharacterized protein FIBRA_01947 [Fibroporia radiculosa]|uniref:Uncharacterized protein n=1 Tax=Fibroporia radiculosa TaxID=599839 RepID=J4HU53_9APHY|nr:uncharacterized protein FIBRA_01947 [Fibroporia radiculosa]CCL99922.1 predicted protein [Fibroporia radiculosa]